MLLQFIKICTYDIFKKSGFNDLHHIVVKIKFISQHLCEGREITRHGFSVGSKFNKVRCIEILSAGYPWITLVYCKKYSTLPGFFYGGESYYITFEPNNPWSHNSQNVRSSCFQL